MHNACMTTSQFQKIIYDYYHENKRGLPWRYEKDPYKIFVSEVMLQQTQVARVVKKYPQFIHTFPTFKSLANASLSDVLSIWQGMGYNRRAKYLKDSSKAILSNKYYSFLLENIKGQSSNVKMIELLQL